MTYQVTIDYKKSASFGPLAVEATNEQDAIAKAKSYAAACGFDQPVKKAKAVPA